jgi:hypothetical protein
LARTLQGKSEQAEFEASEAEFRHRRNIPDPPPRPSETIESSDLCHDF